MPQPRKAWLTDPRAIKPPSLPSIVALKALAQGTATPEQQKRFMTWLVNDVCGYGQNTAYFGTDAALKSYLAMGRHRVAEILKTYIETPIEKFKDGKSSEQVT
jgi:hypothetical protein